MNTTNSNESTIKWLKDNNINYDEIHMRQKNDYRKDSVVKKEIFYNIINKKYKVRFVLDDRDIVVNMWRDLGLDCYQVYKGNF